MFKFEEFKGVHLEITNRCQASCPMCPRNIHGGLENPLLKINDWSLSDFKSIFSEEVLAQLEYINFCGNFGDPVINNELIDMCEYIKSVNPNINQIIHTNGSMRNTKWWERLAAILPNQHKVVFALDGLSDTHHLHRIGTSFELVIKNAKTFINNGGIAHWDFIRFRHNQHQVDDARNLAKELGFKEFIIKDSKRFSKSFPVVDKDGVVTHYIDQPTDSVVRFVGKSDVVDHHKWDRASEISCFAKKDKEIYIDSHYMAMPCCMIGAFLYMNYDNDILKKHNLYFDNHVNDVAVDIQKQVWDFTNELGGVNVLERGLRNLITSDTWQTIWQKKWDNKQSSTCIIMCSLNSPYISINDQKTKKIKLEENV